MAATSKSLVWLITGSSSGFGASLTMYALKAGHKVIATSRNPSKTPDLVKQVEDLGGIWLPLDVTASSEKLREVVAEGQNKFGTIDVLVNNAGYSILGAIEDMSPKEAQVQMDTNFFGPFKLIQAVLPAMREQLSGAIVNISSELSLEPGPTMGIYSASKKALEGMTQALASEIKPFGIRTFIIQPGTFTTNMQNAIVFTEKPTSPHYLNTDVGKYLSVFSGDVVTHKSPNDVNKGARAIFEVVTGTGLAEGKEELIKTPYIRVPISANCANMVSKHIENLQRSHDVFKEVWESTRHDDGLMH
ncbi:hypothetical protein F5884DRAFT_683927 [Xylogone sp. PMI_703]|nr:hypothetical protein F5884DRAFT_683927 [Xylogone sp. PMI_703]